MEEQGKASHTTTTGYNTSILSIQMSLSHKSIHNINKFLPKPFHNPHEENNTTSQKEKYIFILMNLQAV